jgi:hypothetical protein
LIFPVISVFSILSCLVSPCMLFKNVISIFFTFIPVPLCKYPCFSYMNFFPLPFVQHFNAWIA